MKIIVGLNRRYIFNCPITIIFVRIGPYNNLKKVLALCSLDLWSLNLYGITNIFHYWHWIWHWNTLPYISSYFITSKLYIRPSNTNTMNNYPIHNKNNDFDNNISKYYKKIRKNCIFCSHYFWGVITIQGVIWHPRVPKVL